MIKTYKEYYPLYKDDDHFIFLITGGRGSGKSFSTSTFIERLTFELFKDSNGDDLVHNILYTRYTMVSAGISVIPEFWEKVELDGTEKYFHRTKTDIINKMTGARIMFRGIHTSSGNQTAKLKSIHGITTLVVDEAEEWTSEEEFDKIVLSIRKQGIKNRVIIIMNPADSNHFIYKKYIEKTHKIVEYDGVPVQISTHPNVCHIHVNYQTNAEHLSPDFIREVEALKESDPEKYAHVIMGRWTDVAEGAVFKNWGIVDEFPEYAEKQALAVDFGYSCFRGDTLITTLRGDIPIKDVRAGDYVLTRRGYKRVLEQIYNGQKEVIGKEIITSSNRVVIYSTYDHNFSVNGKWKKYGQLTKKDNLCVLLSSTERCTNDTLMANTRGTTITSGNQRASIIQNSFITRFTSLFTGKSPKGMSYTTRTETLSTTTLKTSNVSLYQSIQRFIGILPSMQRLIRRKCESEDLIKKTGIRGENLLSRSYRKTRKFARDVVRSLLLQTHIRSIVQSRATDNGGCKHQNVSLQKSAPAAVKNLGRINTTQILPAQRSVESSIQPIQSVRTIGREICDVYDLSIEGVNEYFANGVLVHNCDPTAILRCGIVGNRAYFEEKCYKTHLTSAELIAELKAAGAGGEEGLFVYADSADPRLIDEIALAGIIIYPVQKGGGSILAGITKMQSMELFVTKESHNLQTEMRNYVWEKDKDGNYINQPIDAYNHCIDCARYYVLAKILGKIMKPRAITKADLGIM